MSLSQPYFRSVCSPVRGHYRRPEASLVFACPRMSWASGNKWGKDWKASTIWLSKLLSTEINIKTGQARATFKKTKNSLCSTFNVGKMDLKCYSRSYHIVWLWVSECYIEPIVLYDCEVWNVMSYLSYCITARFGMLCRTYHILECYIESIIW